MKRIVWVLVSGLMALSLVMAACGPAEVVEEEEGEVAEEEVVSPDTPQYGGTIVIVWTSEPRHFDGARHVGQNSNGTSLVSTSLWLGDWAKGNAGGYGSGETDWTDHFDIWEHKAPNIAESWKWSIDEEKGEGSVVYQIRQGLHWGLDQNNEASVMVGGREITADDIVYNLERAHNDTRTYMYGNPDLRAAEITKTGPWEVTVTTNKLEVLSQIICRFSGGPMAAPEVIEKYGSGEDWKNSVSCGPFILEDYVAGSVVTFVKNPTYWGVDPVGPGKGNQLPYVDGVDLLIITDQSTRDAAVRTGKIDVVENISWEDIDLFRKTAPGLKDKAVGRPTTGPMYIFMNTTKSPFDDIQVRRAMSMAIDMQAINDSLCGGVGQIITWPHCKVRGYEDLYLGLDDPDMPESVRELYSYNPEKAKQLLAEAGYPEGFKTSAIIEQRYADDFAIFKDYFAKVGIDMELEVKERGSRIETVREWRHEAITHAGHNPIGIWYMASDFWGKTQVNGSCVDDPVINEMLAKLRITLVTEGSAPAMAQWREMMKHLYDQAYVINMPKAQAYTIWWPWVKNFSAEKTVGYYVHPNWTQFVWIDQDLKEDMGY